MATPLRVGDRYELRGVLGRGGMAEIRDGWDVRLGRSVAVKLLHPGFSADADSRLRFHAEAHSAAALTHPNIVAIYDYGDYEGTPYIVMERLPGHSLADHIARGPLEQSRVRVILDEVLSALAVAHGAGILHRDIKPANILFTAQGAVKVADFGIAKTTANSYTQAGQIVGTLPYLTPERLSGRPAEPSDDLYAVGCVGYESLSGRRLFPQEDLGALTRAILADTPAPILALQPSVAPVLASVVERAIARDPRQRFGSADDMRSMLSSAAVTAPPAPPRRPPTAVLTNLVQAPPVSVPGRPDGPRSRHVGKRFAVAGIVACLVLAAILMVVNSPFDGSAPTTTDATTSSPPPPTTPPSSITTPTTTVPPTSIAEVPPQPGKQKDNKGRGNGRH